MKTQTSIVAKQVRLQQWVDQIKDCQSRPKGMTVETWCENHQVSKANYYYRLRCVREACLEQVRNQAPEFVELPVIAASDKVQTNMNDATTVAILHGPNEITVEVLSTATTDFLSALIGAFNHVK